MTGFNEALHPRATTGQFTTKENDAPAVELEVEGWDLDDEEWEEDDEWPPTAEEVEDARRLMEAIGSRQVRPRDRRDWERANGGYGPTVGQVRAEAQDRADRRSAYEDARDHYEHLKAAYEASNPTPAGAGR